MIRMVVYLLAVGALAAGLSWLADRPGNLVINWEGLEVQTSVFRAVVMFALLLGIAIFLWSVLRQVWSSPALLGNYFNRRRQERGLDAISSGMIAIGAGDRSQAMRSAVQARKSLPNEPLTQLLRAQAAQLAGDRSTSRRIFEAMLNSPDTEQLGLRGLYLEAEREGEREAANQFASRALRLNPKLGWPVEALFEMQARDGDWDDALATLAAGRKNGHFEKAVADRRRAVLLTAQAQEIEDSNGAKALELAGEAHRLAPDLIPAAVIAGRQLASRGTTSKAAKIIERTWKQAAHPDLALVYAFARPGDSPKDRLSRIKRLSRLAPHSPEGPIALATAAIEAKEWGEARAALESLVDGRLSQRVCTLMARLEGEENNDAGRVREWLARAVNAPRDPAWTADGVVADRWAPISPATGALDAFEWRVPPESNTESDAARALKNIEELMLLGTRPATAGVAPHGGVAGGAGIVAAGAGSAESRPGVEPLREGARRPQPREADADRPITIEVHPVTSPDAGGNAAKPGATSRSGVPLHPAKPASGSGSSERADTGKPGEAERKG